MKKRLLSWLLVVCMVFTLLPVGSLTAFAAEGDLPTIMTVEPSETNNLPAGIDLYRPSSSSSTYHLYLPGNVDSTKCFFSWADGLSATMSGATYASGACPVPAPGETKTYTFTKGTQTKNFQVTTYRGSAEVPPIFIEIDESITTIAAMNGDANHNTECTGIIYIDGEQHTLSKMKGRGNATWSQAKDKRPYNITLGKKATILGLDEAPTKKYSMLANIADRSLLRNKVAYDVAKVF